MLQCCSSCGCSYRSHTLCCWDECFIYWLLLCFAPTSQRWSKASFQMRGFLPLLTDTAASSLMSPAGNSIKPNSSFLLLFFKSQEKVMRPSCDHVEFLWNPSHHCSPLSVFKSLIVCKTGFKVPLPSEEVQICCLFLLSLFRVCPFPDGQQDWSKLTTLRTNSNLFKARPLHKCFLWDLLLTGHVNVNK